MHPISSHLTFIGIKITSLSVLSQKSSALEEFMHALSERKDEI